MAHFAQIDDNNYVTQVIVVANSDCRNADGNESEEIGREFCQRLLGGRWVQTSYNNNIRKQYAGIGYTYDEDADVFVAPKPFDSWVLDENHDWQPPVARPAEGRWFWNETEGEWQPLED